MSYWNKILLNKFYYNKNQFGLKIQIKTDIGRFYFYIKNNTNPRSFSIKVLIFLNL